MISGIGFSQNFKLISFEEDLSDLSAVKYARKDVNDDKCAIIKVYTNLDNLYFETRLGIEGDIVNKTGEFWIYVSPKEKQLKIIKEGYIPLEYSIPVIVEESKVYKLTLTGSGNNFQPSSSSKLTEYVVFETEPSGAQIYINKQPRGTTPLTIPMIEGNYTCKITMPLFQEENFELNVKSGNTLRISKVLTEMDIYGNINIRTDLGTDIYIDKQKVGTETYSGRLIEGLHIITIEKENYKSYKKDLLIVANKNYEIDQVLEPKLGVISVQSEPLGASIFIDGDFKGTTPKFVRDIMCGEHHITIEKEGFSSVSENIYIPYDKTKEFTFKLDDAKTLKLTTEPAGADVYLNNVLIGHTPVNLTLDKTNLNKIKILKDGYHTVFDEIPPASQLAEKTYKLERLGLSRVANQQTPQKTEQPKSTKKNKYKRNHRENRTKIGWSLSGISGKPGGISTSLYGNFGSTSQYGIFIDAGYQFNKYSNNYIDGVVNFPRFAIGGSYQLWLWDFAVVEAFGSAGLEFATGLNWKTYSIWDYPPDEVHTKHLKIGLRAAIRISPHAELFGAYNINYTDGPALDVFGDQVEINGTRFNYQTLFPDREAENWEIGIRFVIY